MIYTSLNRGIPIRGPPAHAVDDIYPAIFPSALQPNHGIYRLPTLIRDSYRRTLRKAHSCELELIRKRLNRL
jgi:hypothetical protein